MGDPAKTTKQPVTTMSWDFVLRERVAKLFPSKDSDTTEDTTYVQDVWNPVTGRWVYVLQMFGNDDKSVVKWYGEYRVDDKGGYYPADMSKAADKAGNPTKERQDRQPETEILNPNNRLERLAFHHTINGKRAYYGFYLSSARLPLDSIKKMLTAEFFNSLQPADLKEDSNYRVHSTWDNPTESTDAKLQQVVGYPDKVAGKVYVSAFDVLSYGMSLNRVMQQLRILGIAWFSPAKDENEDKMTAEQRTDKEAQRKRTIARQKKWVLAGAVNALVANEQSSGANISGYLHKGDLDNFINHYNDVMKKRHDDLETWAKTLTDWLDSKLMAFTVEANLSLLTLILADEQNCVNDLARFITAYAACMDRLMESSAGFVWLSKTVADKSHFIQTWVLNTSTSPKDAVNASKDVVKVFRKASKPFYWIFKEVFIPYRAQFKITTETKVKHQSLAAQYTDRAGNTVDYQIAPQRFLFDTLETEVYVNKAGQTVTVRKTVKHIDIEDTSIDIEARQFGSTGAQGTPPPAPPATDTDTPADPNATPADVDGTGVPHTQQNSRFEPVLTTIVTRETPPANWSHDFTDQDIADIKKSMTSVLKVLTAVNLCLAIYDLADQGANGWTVTKLVSGLGSAVTTFEEVSSKTLSKSLFKNLSKELAEAASKKTLQKISWVTAMIDVVTSTHDALKASDKGDMVAAGGYFVAGMGSGLVAVGTALAIFGTETSFTGIGLIIGLIGTAIAMFGGSEPLEDFAKHCVWGRSYGQDSGDTKWSQGPFSGWHEKNPDGLDRQLRAIFNLLGAFRVHGLNSLLHIDFGIVPAKVNIKYNCVQYGGYSAGGYSYSSEIVLDLRERTAELITAPTTIQTQTYVRLDESFVIVLQQFEDTRNPGQLKEWPCSCEVRLDVQGDQSLWTPGSGVWVPYIVEYDDSFADIPASYTDPKARLADDELLTSGRGLGSQAPHASISPKTGSSMDY